MTVSISILNLIFEQKVFKQITIKLLQLEKITKQVRTVLEELAELKEIVSRTYNKGTREKDLEIPFNTFLYKIDWLKDQLKTDFGHWITDCDQIRIDRLKENL